VACATGVEAVGGFARGFIRAKIALGPEKRFCYFWHDKSKRKKINAL
jgi:hypothetical protein